MFKKKTGETFSDFMMKVRIEKAKQLMQDERLNLKEISYEVRYKDPNYLVECLRSMRMNHRSNFGID